MTRVALNWCLCRLGLHRYREVRVLEQRLEWAKMTLDDDVCKGCGKLRDPENAKGVLRMMQANWPEGVIIAHPSVLK